MLTSEDNEAGLGTAFVLLVNLDVPSIFLGLVALAERSTYDEPTNVVAHRSSILSSCSQYWKCRGLHRVLTNSAKCLVGGGPVGGP